MGVTGTHKTKRRKRVENDRKSEGSRRKEKKTPHERELKRRRRGKNMRRKIWEECVKTQERKESERT